MTTKKYWIIVILIVIAVPFAFKYISSLKKEVKKNEKAGLPVAFVDEVKNESMDIVVNASGRLSAKHGFELYSEVTGVLDNSNKEFRVGVAFKKGETLFRMDDSEIKAQLFARRSDFLSLVTSILPDIKIEFPDQYQKWEDYLSKIDVEKSLSKLPNTNSKKEKFFISSKKVISEYYNIKNLEVKFDKYHIRAPFNGVLTEALVNPGGLVRANQKLGTFSNLKVFELEVAVKHSDANFVSVGDKVNVYSSSRNMKWEGEVVRINGALDQNSQTVSIFIELQGDNLKPGMYLDTEIVSKPVENAYKIQRNLIHNNRFIFVVQDSLLKLKPINSLKTENKFLIVNNLEDGEMILSRNIVGAYEGMKVNPSKN